MDRNNSRDGMSDQYHSSLVTALVSLLVKVS